MADREHASTDDGSRARFYFDDEPLESILYGEPSAGPTSANLFAHAAPRVRGVKEAFDGGDLVDGLRQMGEALRGTPLPGSDLLLFVGFLRRLIPTVPCPVIQDHGVPYHELLQPIFEAGLANDDETLTEAAGFTLCRYFEGHARFSDAARGFRVLIGRAQRKGDKLSEAVLTNNLGYDYLCDKEWARAERYFVRCIQLFDQVGPRFEQANARVNLLLARFERNGDKGAPGLQEELAQLLASLGHDWRRRKALVLLARLAEGKGDPAYALDLMRQAVAASEGVPTRHRFEDQAYLGHLEEVTRASGTP